jgi:hypothetical protein
MANVTVVSAYAQDLLALHVRHTLKQAAEARIL